MTDTALRVYRDADDPDRLMALAIYAETGSITTASRHSGIAPSTIASWVEREDGAETIESLRIAARAQSAHKYMALTSMAQDLAMERLVKGDPHVTKDGRVVYHPVKYRDLMVGASIATDKTYLIAGALNDGAKVNSALRDLASQLTQAIAAGVAQGLGGRASSPDGLVGGELG